MARPSFFSGFRNRLLSDPGFLRLVQRLPLFRLIARYKSRKLFDLVAGFAYAQILYSCVELGLIEKVGRQGASLAELAGLTGWPLPRLERLLRAAAALDIFEFSGPGIIWGEIGATLAAQPWIQQFILHHQHLYRDLVDPSALMRGDGSAHALRDFWGYDNPAADRAAYSSLMEASQAAVSEQVLLAHDFAPYRRMLDIGGGSGAFLRAVAARHPKLDMHLFDLPGVTGNGPFTRHGGDFRTDSLPGGMDLISLVRVVHDHDDAAVLTLLTRARDCASADATLLVAEPFAGSRETDAYFTVYFAAMGQGRLRTPQEIAALAANAGWGAMRISRTNLPMITGLLTLRRL